MKCGVLECGVWSGVGSVKCEVWSVKCGVWRVKCEVWNLEWVACVECVGCEV